MAGGSTEAEVMRTRSRILSREVNQTLTSSNGAEPKEMSDPANAPLKRIG